MSNMTNLIKHFENNSSMYTTNKFSVLLFGEYIESALAEMAREIGDENTLRAIESRGNVPDSLFNEVLNRSGENLAIWERKFTNWLSLHQKSNGINNYLGMDLLWKCKSINIPNTKPKITKDFNIDSIKGISYPLITGVDPNITVTMTIIEDRSMMMYQFFNAIMNQFFNTQELRAKSSFQKVNMEVFAYQGDEYFRDTDTDISELNKLDRYGGTRNTNIREETANRDLSNERKVIYGGQDLILNQRFEFNSIVPSSVSDIKFTQDPTILEFDVTFECPNPFQKEFSERANQGLRDLSSNTTLQSGNNLDYDTSRLER
jgi:hypothetical protein